MERKRAAPAVVALIVSYFKRLGRSASPLCVGALAFNLLHLTQAPLPAPRVNLDVGDVQFLYGAFPPPQAPHLPDGADDESASRDRGDRRVSRATAAATSPLDNLERIRRAADMLIEVNAALGAPRSPYGQLIYDIALRHSVNPHLVAAVIHAESAFNPRAVSRKGACGLMQLLPETARRFGLRKRKDLFDPKKNLEAGVRYLKWLTRRFGGDAEKILAAYNAGEGAVERFGGIPPYRETQQYVKKVFGLLGFSAEHPAAERASGGVVGAGK